MTLDNTSARNDCIYACIIIKVKFELSNIN